MPLKVSQRGRISPFIVMEVMRAAHARAAAGGDVIHLEVGQPSTGAPQTVIAAAQAALSRDRLGYTEALGLPNLRARIARRWQFDQTGGLCPAQMERSLEKPVKPGLVMQLRRPVAALIDHQHRRIHDAIGQGLGGQPPRLGDQRRIRIAHGGLRQDGLGQQGEEGGDDGDGA